MGKISTLQVNLAAMQIQNLIENTLPVFGMDETLKKVIAFFEETTFSHIAVSDNNRFKGLLAVNDLGCFEPEKKVSDFKDNLEHFSAYSEILWLDLLEIFSQNEANIVPVLNLNEQVVGYFDLQEIVSKLSETPFFTEPGGVIVVSKGIKDYSFSELSQIVESNNTKMLGALITDSQNDVVQITIKLGTANLSEILQTFRRYNYNIEFGTNDDQFMEGLKQRSEYLTKYLNV